MPTAQVTFDINDDNMTAENWAAFLEVYPLSETPPDVSTKALKLTYIGGIYQAKLNRDIHRGLNVISARATGSVDLNA